MKRLAFISLLMLGSFVFADTATWSCAAYCNYSSSFQTNDKAMEGDGATLSAAFKALADQCDAVKGVLIGGTIAGATGQSVANFSTGIISAMQACAKN